MQRRCQPRLSNGVRPPTRPLGVQELRVAAREHPEQLASQILPTDLVQVIALLAQVPAAVLTSQQCWYTIARYGSYLHRRNGGPPGWKTLWKGCFYIHALLEGVHLAARLSLD